MSSTEHANEERHYILLTVAIVIGLVGVYLRFAGDAPYYSWIANVILIFGVAVALKAVFSILK
ncbi:MAG: hypothetical protein JWQ66_1496 [Mucilaginibacter sp.]|nr:hypothetical protein [Mucilaginibacter sp.]